MEVNVQGTKTEANLLKHWKAKSVEKMERTIYSQIAMREEPSHRALGNFLTEQATHSYVHAAHLWGCLWEPYHDMEKNLAYIADKEHTLTHDFTDYAKTAREEGFEDIASAFEMMANIDHDHQKKFLGILENVKNDRIFTKDEEQDWYCQQCGNVYHGISAPDNCPLCNAVKRFFELKGANFSTF